MISLVAVHGFALGPASFCDVTRALHPLPLLALELPGHGGRAPASFKDAVDEVSRSVLAHAQACALWGYSLGARIALAVACRTPLAGLVLESGCAGLVDEGPRAERRALDESRARDLEMRGLDAFFRDWDASPLFLSMSARPDVTAARHALRARHDPRALAAALRAFSPGYVPAAHSVLAEICVPTLLLAGEADARFVAEARTLHDALPCARMAVLAGCGHAPHLEDPQATAAQVAAFLESIDNRSSQETRAC